MRRLIVLVSILALILPTTALARDPGATDRPVPDSIEDLRLDEPIHTDNIAAPSKLGRSLRTATGTQAVIVTLTAPAVAEVAADGDSAAEQQNQARANRAQQAALVAKAKGLDRNAVAVADVQVALNAVALEIDAAALPALAAEPTVESIHPVVDYELDLSETVPYIGATAAQGLGFTGDGVTVAVLDTGIDYTHVAFGGPGTSAAYDAAYGANIASPENTETTTYAFPDPDTNVIGGYDFVGEFWPSGPLAPDPDPIDCGGKPTAPPVTNAPLCSGGHGTHVSDIIAGAAGVAPDASLYAVKICSAVATSCSGVALIQGMDFAADPNGDDSTDDAVDIINMSLGSPYGQAFDDDLSQAVENASGVGVLTVASAGNSSDKPYISGSPAAAPSALSVAQTNVPSATQAVMEVISPASIAGLYQAVFQPWSKPLEDVGAVEAPLQYGDGAGGNLNGCAAFAAGSLTGKIVLVNRGACDFSLKISNVAEGGGLIGIIGLVAPGDPFQGGLGACSSCDDIPGFMISQVDANALKSEVATGVVVRFDPDSGLSLTGHMVGSSSRGPTMLTNIIKPEIGAPGASISAVAGSATGTSPFGGTSGAAPMVSGSAALLAQAFPDRSPAEVKAVLMNTAETEIFNSLAAFGGDLAPISRIGGGEVRVDRALNSPAAAWDKETQQGALSFGFHDVTDGAVELNKTVTVRNYSSRAVSYRISVVFRFDEDEGGAVSLESDKKTIAVLPRSSLDVPFTLRIDGAALQDWIMNSGSGGANAGLLTGMEYDGYVLFDDLRTKNDDSDPLHVAWHVLPRLAGDVAASSETVAFDGEAFGFPAGTVDLTNSGVGTARVDAYSLLGTSPNQPEGGIGAQSPIIDLKSIGVTTIPVPTNFCSANASFLMVFAVNTWERQTHANAPAAFEWDLDTNGDGGADYAVFNLDAAFNLSDGRNLTFVQNLATGRSSAFFFTDHGTNSGNTSLTICGEQIGMNASSFGTPITANVLAVDAYFTGNVTDAIENVQFSPLGERYFGVIGDDGFGSGDIAPGATETLTVLDFGVEGTNPSETGLLLFLDAARGGGIRGGAPADNEALTIAVE